jgi:hypothetical protein
MDGQIIRFCGGGGCHGGGGGCYVGSPEAMSGVAELPKDVIVTKYVLRACISKF